MSIQVQLSDLKGIERNGARGHSRGLGYFDNPYFGGKLAELPLEEWQVSALAWASGWLSEDKGRDPAMQKLLQLRWW